MAEKKKQPSVGAPTISNKKAYFNYEILETWQAGLALVGCEVKSIRLGGANLQDAYCEAQNDEMWLLSCYIAPYAQGNRENPETRRPRKLLLHKNEILKMKQLAEEKSLTLIPLKMFFLNGKVKVEIGLCRGKKLYDKREAIKRREESRHEREQREE
jgi:SsrA-binding protein